MKIQHYFRPWKGQIPRQFHLVIITLLLLFWIGSLNAATGARSPFQRYTPAIDVYPQNFAIAEDQLGNIYVGNSDGLLQFDGRRWSLTAMPNGDIVRSLMSAPENRIYVGGYDEFGYVEANATGEMQYTNLARLFQQSLGDKLFADIWDIALTPEGVFFKALQHAFFWSPETGNTQVWFWEGRFGAIAHHEGETYLQFRGEGFRRFENNEWVAAPATQSLTTLVSKLVPLPDGDLLTISRDGAWNRLNSEGVTPFEMPADMPRSSSLTDGVELDANTLAFSGDLGLLYLYNLKSGDIERVTLGQGFLSDLVKSRQGGLLATDDSGFFHVPWPAKWKIMDGVNGLLGSVYRIKEIDGNLYALTASGVFIKPGHSDQFTRIDWSEHETWDLLDMGDGTKLLAESYGLRLISDQGTRNIVDETIYPRLLVRSRFNPDLVYVGTELGVALLERQAAGWKLVYNDAAMQNLRVNSLIETAENEIIVGSERGGVQAIRFHQDQDWQATATRIDKPQGIDYGQKLAAQVSRGATGELLISTRAGVYRLENGNYIPALSALEQFRPKGEMITLGADQNGRLWGYTYRSLYQQIEPGQWREEKIGNVREGSINSLFFSDSGHVMVGANASILLHNPDGNEVDAPARSVMLSAVETRNADGVSARLPLSEPATISQKASITFSYSLPDLADPENIRYRARLKPMEAEFSPWSSSAQFTYYSLGPDEYTLEIEAMDGHGRRSAIEPYLVKVQPYWYQHGAVRLMAGAVAVLIVGLIILSTVRTRSRKLAMENQRLEHMVTERTRELASANRQLESIAHLDGLTSIPNRRRLDAYLDEVWQQCRERDRTMAVAMLDVDHFKQFNDTFGHPAGDELLKQLAQLLSRSLRRGEDLVARYGGEEFLVVLPGADDAAALEVAESMRRNVNASKLDITVSIGVATDERKTFDNVNSLIEASDRALYEAKNQGRNRVISA